MRIGVVSVIAALLAGSSAFAQTGSIAGTVRASDGSAPLAGARVVVVGTRMGATSREDGRYTIAGVNPGRYSLRVVRIGYTPDSTNGVVVRADSVTNTDFVMRSAPTALAGVVVIGYGTTQAKDLTGSVSTVTPETFNKGRVVSTQDLVRGKVAGVQVSDNNEPGGGVAIRIRGGTSVSASNEPLFVIDGVPINVGGGSTVNGRNPLNFINPNDIESVTVLKDASSTAIYGNRGANGVIIVTTKSGGAGPAVTYNGTVSGSRVTGGPDMLNAAQYRAAVTQYAPQNIGALGNANTDFLKAVEQNAGGQEHNVALSGRRDAMNYRLGLGFLDQDGVLIGTRTQRASLALNYSDRMLNDRLTVRTHLRGSRSRDWYTPGGVIGNAVAFAPTQPIYTPSGNYFQYRDSTGKLINLAPNNPLEDLKYVQDQGNILRSVGNVEGEYRVPFLTGLTTTLRGGYDVNRADRNGFTPSNITSQLKGDPTLAGSASRANHDESHTVVDAFGNYKHDLPLISGSNLELTAGGSIEKFDGSYNGYGVNGLSTNLLGFNGIPTVTETHPGVTVTQHALHSLFARGNINIGDRYLLNSSVRRDCSSRFALGRECGVFPSAAIAWRVLEEPMFKDRLPLNDLKLRLSYGKNGNESINCDYCSVGRYDVGDAQAQVQFGNTFVNTIRPVGFDPNLHWETTTSTNLGLDVGFWNSRFTGTIDIYNKKTHDLLFPVTTAAGTGLSNSLLTNIGNVENKGIEFLLDGKVIDGGARGFSWDANLNASHNTNKLLNIGRGFNFIETGGIAGGVGTNIEVLIPGQPINSFYVYEHKEKNGRPVVSATGFADTSMYVDRNGDGIINGNDRRVFHNPLPKWIVGHTSNFSFRGFDASTTLRAYLGSYVYNNVASNLGNYSVLTSPYAPVNLNASVLATGFAHPQYQSDYYVEKASFLRMDNLTLGYTFDRLGQLSNARIFGTAQNVFTSTKYKGVDPTANVAGIDNNIYPRSRTFLGGLSVGF